MQMKSLKCFKCLGGFASPLKILCNSRLSMLCACLFVLCLFIPEGSKSHFSPVPNAPTLHAALLQADMYPQHSLSAFFILMSYFLSLLSSSSFSSALWVVDLFLLAYLPFSVLESLLLHQHFMTIISFSHKSPPQKDLNRVPSDPIQSHLTLWL